MPETTRTPDQITTGTTAATDVIVREAGDLKALTTADLLSVIRIALTAATSAVKTQLRTALGVVAGLDEAGVDARIAPTARTGNADRWSAGKIPVGIGTAFALNAEGTQLTITRNGQSPLVVDLSGGSTPPPATPDTIDVMFGAIDTDGNRRDSATAQGVSQFTLDLPALALGERWFIEFDSTKLTPTHLLGGAHIDNLGGFSERDDTTPAATVWQTPAAIAAAPAETMTLEGTRLDV